MRIATITPNDIIAVRTSAFLIVERFYEKSTRNPHAPGAGASVAGASASSGVLEPPGVAPDDPATVGAGVPVLIGASLPGPVGAIEGATVAPTVGAEVVRVGEAVPTTVSLFVTEDRLVFTLPAFVVSWCHVEAKR